MFIEFCGIDGSGKSTQAKLLHQYFCINNKKCTVVHGYKPSLHSSQLREARYDDYESYFTPELKSMAHMLDVIDTTKIRIAPSLKNGTIVISDNYCMGSRVYAPIMGCDYQLIEKLSELTITPSIILLLNLSPLVAYERVKERNALDGTGSKLKESLNIMNKAQKRYIELIDNWPNAYILNAELDAFHIHEFVKSIVQKYN